MDGTLFLSRILRSFTDTDTPNPQKKSVDWQLDQSVSISNAKTEIYTVPANSSLVLFNGTRTISADNTTQWVISLNPLATDRYRFTNNAGTAPALRTSRGVNLNTQTVHATYNPNLTLTVVANAASFSAVQVNDTVFVPGVTTGDAVGPFSAQNEGYWQVLYVSTDGSTLQLARPTGVDFSAATETVTILNASFFQVFSSDNVQVGDSVVVNAGFSNPVLKSYTVIAVNPSWFEVLSTDPLPIGAQAMPGTTGIQFYFNAKRYLEVYVDQRSVLHLNGNTDDSNTITPWAPADMNNVGSYAKTGPTWSATLVNKTAQALNVVVITAE